MVESLSRLLVVREWKHIMCFLLSAFRRSKHCDYANGSVFTCLKSKYIPFILSTHVECVALMSRNGENRYEDQAGCRTPL